MSDLPRLSGAIRAFSGLSNDYAKRSPSGQSDLQLKRQQVSKKKTDCLLTWEKLGAEIRKVADASGSDVKTALKDLSQCARSIVGQEASLDMVESAAAFLFDVFKSVDIVANKEAIKLRNIFGPYPASAATKACNTVRKIVSWLPEDTSLLLGNQDREEAEGAASVTEFGQGIKFLLPEVDWNDCYSSSESDGEDNDRREVDLKYSETKSPHALKAKNNAAAGSNEGCGVNAGWLQREVNRYFPSGDTGLGMSAEDISSTIFDFLTSAKTSSELQNDLFELLGFERFELIEKLLQNRQEVIEGALTDQQTSKQPSSMRKKGDGANKPAYGCQVTIQSEQEKKLMKQMRKDEKRSDRRGRTVDDETGLDFDPERMRAEREAALRAAASAPLFSGRGPQTARERYPNVYDAMEEARQSSAFVGGVKMSLPDAFKRSSNKLYEEVTIPHTEASTISVGDTRVQIASLDEIGQMAFRGTKALNRIQSVVFEAAYKTNENLLICAPTGAGKTNIAMLTILHEIKQHLSQGVIKKDEFKVIYVAPMKALAAEMVRNFGSRLEPLGITVRELTGDMQLTKAEILKTQMLVTTPEKWDVVTRKSTGDVALAQLVKLLIIDEVHLLHDDRGSVIESLVARTLRQVESTQNMIRIIGLSATLPNYLDVARFLHVNFYLGLFFFDGRFRPVPLSQTFIGVKATSKVQQLHDMNTVCYEKVLEQVRKGYQTMVFVHARNDTVRTASVLRDMAKNGGDTGFFTSDGSAQYGEAQKNIMKSRNKQLKELFVDGFGIHHAGMLRQDRNLVERYFSQGLIKCLVCTATLAWGVNLPAHAVIIKGTQIYDAKRGSFVDLGILDVMQIFGRAGRPQFDKFGHGTIISCHDKLSHYLSLMTRQNPIESQFVNSMTDNLNAEIALGTVTNVEEAVKWLSYTYLFVRMKCNPLVYGVNYNALETDPQLENHRRELITNAGRKLDKAKMVRFDERTNYFSSTDMGRIASHFYIKYDTVEVINEHLKPVMTEADVFAVLSKSQEFDQIKVREDEMQELEGLLNDTCVMQVPGGVENNYGKINILLQAYVSRMGLESFSLISDQAYVAQNGGRIIRALFEICLRNSWPIMASRLLNLCKTIDKRLWGFENPLRQFPMLSSEILYKLEAKKLSVQKLKEMDSKEIGHMVHHVRMGSTIKKCVNQIPALDLEATIQPITRTVLRVRLTITPEFKWDDKVHGTSAESFWVWVEDPETNHIYHSELFLLHKKMVRTNDPQILVFTIPIFEPLPTQYYVKAVSDRWLGSEAMCAISFQHLILPERHPPHTELLDLQPLPVTALNDPSLEMLYKYTHFNPIQTQIFHVLYHTDSNVLLGAPTGSGKTVAAEMAIFKVFRDYPKAKAVYIAPLKALVRERMEDWKVRIEQKLGRKVVELTGDVTPDMRAVANADLIVTTPEKWDGVSRSWQTRNYVKAVALLVIDEIHLLGDERGPVLEVIVSRTNFISSHTAKPVRVVGLSTALANARDLADWLGIKQMGLYNFRPSVRPVPLEVHISGFPGQHYCPRMATMNKPTFQAIKTHSPEKPTLVFVSSRRQTRLTALDLIAFLAAEENPKQWLHNPEMELRSLLKCGRRIMGRRVPYRIYFMCLCGLYLLVVFVFHGRLQLDIAKSQITSSSQISQNTGTKTAVSADKSNSGSSGSKNNIVRQIRSVKSRQMERVLESPISEPSLCLLKATTKEYHYVNVIADSFYVYSAYLDERYRDMFVRVLALIVKGKKNKVNVKCHYFENGAWKYVNNASIYEMCENHNKKYGGYILSCKVPETKQKPCRIGISVLDRVISKSYESKTVILNITNTSPSTVKYDYGVCIPPLFGDIRRESIVEFIELTKLLGAQHFMFYDYNITNSGTNQVLDYYTREGTVTVIPWKLPENIEERNIWYHGQLLAHNDCLNRAMSLMRVVSINDIDEYVIPHDNNYTWQTALSYLMQSNVIGLSFNSAFYDPVVGTRHSSGLLTVGNTGRSKLFSRVRTKVMLQPHRVFEVGIHHVSKPAQEGLIIKKVDTDKAYLHHYRKCVSNYGMKCLEFEQDNTIYKYYEQLKANYDKVLHSVDQSS